MLRALLVLLITATSAFSQIKIEGPKEGTVGYRVKAKLTLDVDDPKITCTPSNEDWMCVQDIISGQKYIDFVPGKRSGTRLFTFTVAGNKSGKTYLEQWEVSVKSDEPTPVPNDELYKSLLASYQVSPDADALKGLISVYESWDLSKYTNNKQASEALAEMTKARIGTRLQSTRDVVGDFFITQVGQRATAWDQQKLSAALSKVLQCLKTIQQI